MTVKACKLYRPCLDHAFAYYLRSISLSYALAAKLFELHGRNIDVDVSRGAVTLSGVVRSEAERKRVLETVWGVKGVKSVQTDIKIEPVKP